MAYLAADLPMQVKASRTLKSNTLTNNIGRFQIIFATSYTIGTYVISSQPLEISRFLMVLLVHSMVALIAAGMGVMYGTLVSPVVNIL